MPEIMALAPGGGEVAVLVSRSDWRRLYAPSGAMRPYRWRLTLEGYVYRNTSVRVRGRKDPMCVRVYMHREVVGLKRGDPRQANHKNRDPTDNRRTNLEVLSAADNMRHWMLQDGRMG